MCALSFHVCRTVNYEHQGSALVLCVIPNPDTLVSITKGEVYRHALKNTTNECLALVKRDSSYFRSCTSSQRAWHNGLWKSVLGGRIYSVDAQKDFPSL